MSFGCSFDPLTGGYRRPMSLMTNCKTRCRVESALRADRADDTGSGWGGRQGAGAIATVEQFLIRGLDTACQGCVVGLPRSDSGKSALPLPNLVRDSPDRRQRPGHCLRCSALVPRRKSAPPGMAAPSQREPRQRRFADHPTAPVTPVHNLVAITRNGWLRSIGIGWSQSAVARKPILPINAR
jgi:hypothetical protein